jgi:hypothetical protein
MLQASGSQIKTKPLFAMNLYNINLYCTSCNNILKPPAVMNSSVQAEFACPPSCWAGALGYVQLNYLSNNIFFVSVNRPVCIL